MHKVSYSCLLVLTKKDDLEKIAAAAANMAVTCCLASWFLFWLDSRGKKIRQLQGCYRQLDNTERERWWMGQLLCQLSVPGQACVCSQVESSRGVRQLDNTKREVSVPWQACVCSQVENSTGTNKSNQRVCSSKYEVKTLRKKFYEKALDPIWDEGEKWRGRIREQRI